MLTLLRIVPAILILFSGFAFIRARLAETKLVPAVAGGAVLGLAAFWLALRILAEVLLFAVASWVSLGVVVLTAVSTTRPWRRGALPSLKFGRDRSILIGLLVFAIIFALSVYASSAALLVFDETMTIHVPLVASVQRGNFPPVDLREPTHPFEYHWGQHFLAAGLAEILGVEPWIALFASNALLAGLAFLLAYTVARREASSFAAALAAVLAVVGGTLNWLSAPSLITPTRSFAGMMNPLGLPFTTGNLIVGGFFWRVLSFSLAWPMCLLLLGIDVLWRGARESKSLIFLSVAFLLLAIIGPGSETMIAAGVAGLLAAIAFSRVGPGSLPWRRITLLVGLVLLVAVLAPFMGGVLRSFIETGSTSHQAKIAVNTRHFGSVQSLDFVPFFRDRSWLPIFSWRFLQDAGPVPWLLIPALIWSMSRGARRTSSLALVALASLVGATAFTLTRFPHNTFRLVNHATVLGAIPVGMFIGELAHNLRSDRVRIVVKALALAATAVLIAAWPLSHLGIYNARTRLPWPTEREVAAVYDKPADHWLRTNTDFQDGVVTIPIERWDILGSGQVSPLGSLHSGLARYQGTAREAVSRLDLATLASLGVEYLYVLRDEVPENVQIGIDAEVARGSLKLSSNESAHGGTIYSIVPARLASSFRPFP